MDDINTLFQKYKLKETSLLKFGFTKQNDQYIINHFILNQQFQLKIGINKSGIINCHLWDMEFDEEYPMVRINHQGPFAIKLEEEIKAYLCQIRNNCFEPNLFFNEQTNRIAKQIFQNYQVEPEFLWENDTDDAAFGNKSTHKWFGLIMKINQIKLDKTTNQITEIINLKLDPVKINYLLTLKGYYPAYHMNKKYWISILLDDTLSDDKIETLLQESYSYSEKK